jgi:hypothetical protein
MSDAILTDGARVAAAAYLKTSVAHLAWGSGDIAWGSTPPDPPANATGLLAEFCRRRATQVEFCTPQTNGSISVPEGKFEISATPTSYLYYKFHFEFEDAVGSTIREMGIFLDTVLASGVPVGQYFLLPAQVANPGRMIVIQRRPPLVREITTRQLFEFVVAW